MNTSTSTNTSATVNVDMISNAVTNINASMHMNMNTSMSAATNVTVLTTLMSVNANLCMFTRTQTRVLSAEYLGGGSSQAYSCTCKKENSNQCWKFLCGLYPGLFARSLCQQGIKITQANG